MSSAPSSVEAFGLFNAVELSGLNVAVLIVSVVHVVVFVGFEMVSHVPYSKFAEETEREKLPLAVVRSVFSAQVPSRWIRTGWFLLYFPALASYAGLWAYYASQNVAATGKLAPSPGYFVVCLVMWCGSFLKRCLEVLIVHRYSGTLPVFSNALIAWGYAVLGLCSLVFANQVEGYALGAGSPTFAKDVVCYVVYVVGFVGNTVCHLKLRWVRDRAEAQGAGGKRYFAPSEIGFPFSNALVAPHYLFEIFIFVALGCFGATLTHWMLAVGVAGYLGNRSVSTHRWYVSKGLLVSSKVDVEARGPEQSRLDASDSSSAFSM
jgi:hypothetical protein